jgi:hypothetical protein
VAVGGEDEAGVEPLAFGVALGLAEAVARREVFLLGLDESQRDNMNG